MTPARFKIGDRVKVRFSRQLPAGMAGTIVRVYTSVQEGYDVQFGGHRFALMWGYELEYSGPKNLHNEWAKVR